jgi:Kdo2-lipid IVA lauroyltransferase/acyltransferase
MHGVRVSLLTPIRYRLEYAAVRLGLALVDLVPLRCCPGLSVTFGDLAFFLDLRRRRIAVDNILRARVADTPAQARRIARASFRHFALLMIESLKAQRLLTPASLSDHMVLHAPPETQALIDDPARGVLAAVGHFGNWEIMGHILSFLKPVVAIAQPMKNPLVNGLMARRALDARFKTIPKHDESEGMMRLVKPIQQGGALAVMIDQHAMKKPVVVDFLGRPACSHRSIARLHLVTQVPIVYAACRRTGLLRYDIRLSKPLAFPPSGDKERDIHDIIKALNEELETDIRRTPEQYLWGHRRWRRPNPESLPQ